MRWILRTKAKQECFSTETANYQRLNSKKLKKQEKNYQSEKWKETNRIWICFLSKQSNINIVKFSLNIHRIRMWMSGEYKQLRLCKWNFKSLCNTTQFQQCIGEQTSCLPFYSYIDLFWFVAVAVCRCYCCCSYCCLHLKIKWHTRIENPVTAYNMISVSIPSRHFLVLSHTTT